MSADGTKPVLPAGTLTFVFTDIEGSTRLVKEIGEAGFNNVLEDHARLVAGAFDADGGHRVRMEGDSFFYVFERATSALLTSLMQSGPATCSSIACSTRARSSDISPPRKYSGER